MKPVAEEYIDLLGGDAKSRMAFIACAASLRLDDEIAGNSIELIAKTNGTTQEILQQIKDCLLVLKSFIFLYMMVILYKLIVELC